MCNCESREPVTCYTSNDSITYRKSDSYYVLFGDVCGLSNQSCESNETIMNQASNNCEAEQCYRITLDGGTQYTVSNYGNKHTWSDGSNMNGTYGQCTESLSNCLSSIEASNLASLCNCESREPVTCYTSNDSITYRKSDSYYVLSGDVCGLSNQSCESNAQEFIDEARSNCENQICRSGQSNEDGSIISLSNVGYTWSNTSNDDGSFGICTPNADPCLSEIEFSPISYEFNETSFNIRYGSDDSYGRMIPDNKLSNHVTFGRPLQLKRGALTFTFLQQPIDMTNSFTVVYWTKMYDTTSAKVLITEHVDAILYYSGPDSSCLIQGQTYNDDIWIPRKRNTIEIAKYDSKHGNNQVHHRICTWAKTSTSTKQEWKWKEFPPGNHHGDHNHEFKYNFVSWKKVIISYDKPNKKLTLYHCLDNGTEINKRTIDDVEYTTTAGYLRFHYYNAGYNGGPPPRGGYWRPMFIDGLQIIRVEALTASQTNEYTRDYVYPEASTITGSTTNTFDIYCNNNVNVNCYVPVGNTSSYLKKQAYHLLDGTNTCILSQPECNRDVLPIENNLRNACENPNENTCTVNGSNVGYKWISNKLETLGTDLRDNVIEIYGQCVTNTTGNNVCDELQEYHLNSTDTN